MPMKPKVLAQLLTSFGPRTGLRAVGFHIRIRLQLQRSAPFCACADR